jgi:hypothetical protein
MTKKQFIKEAEENGFRIVYNSTHYAVLRKDTSVLCGAQRIVIDRGVARAEIGTNQGGWKLRFARDVKSLCHFSCQTQKQICKFRVEVMKCKFCENEATTNYFRNDKEGVVDVCDDCWEGLVNERITLILERKVEYSKPV